MFLAERWEYTNVTNVFKCQAIESEVDHIGCSSDRAQVTCWCVLLTDRPTFHIGPLPTNPPVLYWTPPSPSCVTSLPELSSNSPPLDNLRPKTSQWIGLTAAPIPPSPCQKLGASFITIPLGEEFHRWSWRNNKHPSIFLWIYFQLTLHVSALGPWSHAVAY